MSFSLYTQSFGLNFANDIVQIREVGTGKPAIILTSPTSGSITDNGFARLDSNGNLNVIIDSTKTWHINVFNPKLFKNNVVSKTVTLSPSEIAAVRSFTTTDFSNITAINNNDVTNIKQLSGLDLSVINQLNTGDIAKVKQLSTVNLTQLSELTETDIDKIQALPSGSLVPAASLVAGDITKIQALPSGSLVPAASLTAGDITKIQALPSGDLTPAASLVAGDITKIQALPSGSLVPAASLVAGDITKIQALPSGSLVPAASLVAGDITKIQALPSGSLVAAGDLNSTDVSNIKSLSSSDISSLKIYGMPVYVGAWAGRPDASTLSDGAFMFITNVGNTGITKWQVVSGGWRLAQITDLYIDLVGTSHTASTAEQILKQWVGIPAGVLTRLRYLQIKIALTKSGTTNTCTSRLRLGTAGTTADVQIGTPLGITTAANRVSSSDMWFTPTSTTSIRTIHATTAGWTATTSTALAAAVTVPNMDSSALTLSLTTTMNATVDTATAQSLIITAF